MGGSPGLKLVRTGFRLAVAGERMASVRRQCGVGEDWWSG